MEIPCFLLNQPINFPTSSLLNVAIYPGPKERILLVLRGKRNDKLVTRWVATFPAASIIWEQHLNTCVWKVGSYRVQVGHDKQHRRILRFYNAEANQKDINAYAVAIAGFIRDDKSSPGLYGILASAEGYSGKQAQRFSLVVAVPSTVLTVLESDNKITQYQIGTNGSCTRI